MKKSLAEMHPFLIQEWSDKNLPNLPLTPAQITYGSNKRVWWKGACGHEWLAVVKNRVQGAGCPYCSSNRLLPDLISAYECDPMTCDEEFLLSKRQYRQFTGREQKGDVIAYQIRQSFKPGEVTAEEANRIGYELAMAITKGKHAFIVATHTDRPPYHNHISDTS